MAGTSAALLAVSAWMGVWISGGCFQPVCEAPGGCAHPEGILDAGGEPDAGVDAGPIPDVDAGLDAGPVPDADAGPGGDACAQDSDCPAGTECQLRCTDPSVKEPFTRYWIGHGTCRANPYDCRDDPGEWTCNDPAAGYCDFEGYCVSLAFGGCNASVLCPADCKPVDFCGCLCETCPLTARHGS